MIGDCSLKSSVLLWEFMRLNIQSFPVHLLCVESLFQLIIQTSIIAKYAPEIMCTSIFLLLA